MRLMKDKDYFKEFSRIESKMTASAKTCYSPNLKYPEDHCDIDFNDGIARSGHDSTLGHEYVSLPIQTSRAHTLMFLHNHSNYVSDERSQRYTKIGPNNFYDFGNEELKEWNTYCHMTYEKVKSELMIIMKDSVKMQFGSRWEEYLPKKSQELARLVLPLSTKTNLWHTINAETMTMYMRQASKGFKCHEDFKKELMEKVICHSPTLSNRFKDVVPKNGVFSLSNKMDNCIGFNTNIKSLLEASREIPGFKFEDINNFHPVGKMMSLNTMFVSFNLSSSAVAQLQRHRLLKVNATFVHTKDVDEFMYINKFLEQSESYVKFCSEALDKILTLDMDSDECIYFFPIGRMMTAEIGTDLFSLINFESKRLCLNAQEEIFDLAQFLFNGIIDKNPNEDDFIKSIYGAPCQINFKNGIKPPCPEGSRYCGVKVWKQEVKDIKRLV